MLTLLWISNVFMEWSLCLYDTHSECSICCCFYSLFESFTFSSYFLIYDFSHLVWVSALSLSFYSLFVSLYVEGYLFFIFIILESLSCPNLLHFWHSSYGMGANGLTATWYHYILHYYETNRSEIFVFIVNFSRPLSEFQPLTYSVIQALQTIIKKKFSRVKFDMGWLISVLLLDSSVKNIFHINYLYNMFRFLFEEEESLGVLSKHSW